MNSTAGWVRGDSVSMVGIPHMTLHQISGSRLTVDPEFAQRSVRAVASLARDLQAISRRASAEYNLESRSTVGVWIEQQLVVLARPAIPCMCT